MQIERMDALFEASFSPLAGSGKPLSKCGRCRHYMRLIAARPARLYCATCEEVYPVPQVPRLMFPDLLLASRHVLCFQQHSMLPHCRMRRGAGRAPLLRLSVRRCMPCRRCRNLLDSA